MDSLKVQNGMDALAALDDWQWADGFLHAETQAEKGKRNRQRRGTHTSPSN